MPADLTPTLYKARVGLVRPLSEFGEGERGEVCTFAFSPLPGFPARPLLGPHGTRLWTDGAASEYTGVMTKEGI